MKDTTITDVAERANVSKSTVSAVLNDRDVVKDSTRQRVLDAIQALNYRPRGSARRSFSAPDGKSIGYVIKKTNNPYYPETFAGIQEVAADQGYLTFIGSSEGRDEFEKQIIKQFTNKDLDGLIISPILNGKSDLSHIFDLKRYNIPFVLLEDIRGIQASRVDVDNIQASCEATNYLIDLGHEHILHFSGPESSTHSTERAEGVRRAFSQSPLVFSDERIVQTGDSFEQGYQNALDVFGSGETDVTAVTCYNDLVALGVLKGLRECGLAVPEDVSVVGFDDLNVLDYASIPLTTVKVPKVEMGRQATELLLQQIQAEDQPSPKQISLDAELVIRSSTAPAS